MNHASRLAAILRSNVLMPSPLLTGLLTEWMRYGNSAAVLAAIRRESAARQILAKDLLPPEYFDAHPEGLHLWLRLPSRWDRREFVAHLQRRSGLAVVPSDAFAVETDGPLPEAFDLRLDELRDRGIISIIEGLGVERALFSVDDVLGEIQHLAFNFRVWNVVESFLG